MGIELERKFMVDDLQAVAQLDDGVRLRQGYLAEDNGVELRVRITDVVAVITVKAGIGLSRIEVECAITEAEAMSLWPFTQGRRIEKVRHRVAVGGRVAEVDLYDGALGGLRIVEVEFKSEPAAHEFEVPTWFGRELTGQSEWSNAALARDGRPDR